MIHHTLRLAEIAAAMGALSGIVYNLLCVWSAARFLKDAAATTGTGFLSAEPPISILKPLKGIDPGMHESFRSFCAQNYSSYEIVFGVTGPDDPAVKCVERLKVEFPAREIRLIVCANQSHPNVKAANLAQMALLAKHEYCCVSDSDIRVGPNYLKNVAEPLKDAGNGLVTCLYRAVSSASFGSTLESLGVSTDFAPGVLAARVVESGIKFGLGSTLTFRKADLAAIGGFESVADYLADDYELGRRVADAGLTVVLSREVVETYLPQYSFSEFIEHQFRWSRTVRGARPWGYSGLIFTFALPWALAAIVFSAGQLWAWVLGVIALGCRLAVALSVGRRVLGDDKVLRRLWLIPLRDILGLIIWAGGFAGNTIVWRGERFTLKKGKLVRAI